MKKIVSALLVVFLLAVHANAVFASSSTAPTKAQSAVLAKYMTAVELGDTKLLKSILHPSIKLEGEASKSMNDIKAFIDENDGFLKHVDMKMVKSGKPVKNLGQGFKLTGYVLSATPELYAVTNYSVIVYLENVKGTPKFVTEKSAKHVPIEDMSKLPAKTWAKIEKLLMDKYGDDYFDLLAAEDDQEYEEEESGEYYTAKELYDQAQLEYKDLKFANGVFTNSGSLFSLIALSDTGATSITFKLENTGTADMIVYTDGSGDDEVVKVKAKASKQVTLAADPTYSDSLVVLFEKDYDAKNGLNGKLGFKLSDMKVYTE